MEKKLRYFGWYLIGFLGFVVLNAGNSAISRKYMHNYCSIHLRKRFVLQGFNCQHQHRQWGQLFNDALISWPLVRKMRTCRLLLFFVLCSIYVNGQRTRTVSINNNPHLYTHTHTQWNVLTVELGYDLCVCFFLLCNCAHRRLDRGKCVFKV